MGAPYLEEDDDDEGKQIPANCDDVSDEDASIVDDDCPPSHPSDGVLLLACFK
jgi:hypothetical protein